MAALRVSQDHPVGAAVLDHGRTGGARPQVSGLRSNQRIISELWRLPDLARKRPLGDLEAVLSGHRDSGIQDGPNKVQVDGGRSADNLWKQTPGENVSNFSATGCEWKSAQAQ